MKKYFCYLSLSLVMLLLTSCSAIAKLTPNQAIADPFGFNETVISTELSPNQPQVPEVFLRDVPEVFLRPTDLQSLTNELYLPFFIYNAVDELNKELALAPTALEQPISFPSLTLSANVETVFPERIPASFSGLYLGAWDGFVGSDERLDWTTLSQEQRTEIIASYTKAKENELALFSQTNKAELVFKKDAANCSALSCNYNLLISESDATSIQLNKTEISKVLAIMNSATKNSKNSSCIFAWFDLSNANLNPNLKAKIILESGFATLKFND